MELIQLPLRWSELLEDKYSFGETSKIEYYSVFNLFRFQKVVHSSYFKESCNMPFKVVFLPILVSNFE